MRVAWLSFPLYYRGRYVRSSTRARISGRYARAEATLFQFVRRNIKFHISSSFPFHTDVRIITSFLSHLARIRRHIDSQLTDRMSEINERSNLTSHECTILWGPFVENPVRVEKQNENTIYVTNYTFALMMLNIVHRRGVCDTTLKLVEKHTRPIEKFVYLTFNAIRLPFCIFQTWCSCFLRSVFPEKLLMKNNARSKI